MEQSNRERPAFVQGPDPTPAEIRRLCWEIQATWSPRERRLRAGVYGSSPPIMPPIIETGSDWEDVGGW